MNLNVKTKMGDYPIYMERGGLSRMGEWFDLDRKCLVVTDENIPASYVEAVVSQCGEAHLLTLPAGEGSKTLLSFEKGLSVMLAASFTRKDCVVALGGGVIGDLAGFIASAYLRGVDFYNVPTTVLSQVDSSIGGKVAVNFMGLKNMVGAFYPPKGVLIDPDTLKSLPSRYVAAGLAESVKMAMTFDEEFVSYLEKEEILPNIEKVIEKSLLIKKRVVEEDEREAGLRKVLNFGHTLAHAIESESHEKGEPYFHGEAVALGMIPMCSPEAKERLLPLLKKIGLPTRFGGDPTLLLEAMGHDKKTEGKKITLIRVEKVGSFIMDQKDFSSFEEEVKGMDL